MTLRIFVDTNVLFYARDDRVPAKQDAARRWLVALGDRSAGVVSPQVLGELHNAILRRKVALSPEQAQSISEALAPWCHGATDLELIAAAWHLRTATGYQWWDCVILASAIGAGCRYLLSEDYQHGHTVEGTTIISPFRVDPDDMLAHH